MHVTSNKDACPLQRPRSVTGLFDDPKCQVLIEATPADQWPTVLHQEGSGESSKLIRLGKQALIRSNFTPTLQF